MNNSKILTKLFGFNPEQHSVTTEIMAGLTTFLTMAYILAVNPAILSETGMDKGALFTSAALMSGIATLLMSLIAKLPFALGPGMGLNAFFAYTICIGMGYSWQFALTAVFIEGIIFILLTVSNLREHIVNSLPKTIQDAISIGIGLFIAFIGLQNAGIITASSGTLVKLGDITSGSPLLALIGMIITAILMIRNIKGAMLIGIVITTIIGIPMGVTHIDGLVSTPPSIEPIFAKLEWSSIFSKDMFVVVFTMLFIDLFDTIGTLIGVCKKANMITPNGTIPRIQHAFYADSIATTLGAIMGSSTVTTFVESAAGVNEGGRSGLTSFTTAMCFFAALFLAPFFLSVPGAATAPVLVFVGLMMCSGLSKIDFTNYIEAIPAFICIIFMPLAYSISDGIVFGHLSYVIINLCTKNHKKVSVGMIILAAFFLIKFLL